MMMLTGYSLREIRDLVLLLVACPCEGWKSQFEEITRYEIERLAAPVGESEHE